MVKAIHKENKVKGKKNVIVQKPEKLYKPKKLSELDVDIKNKKSGQKRKPPKPLEKEIDDSDSEESSPEGNGLVTAFEGIEDESDDDVGGEVSDDVDSSDVDQDNEKESSDLSQEDEKSGQDEEEKYEDDDGESDDDEESVETDTVNNNAQDEDNKSVDEPSEAPIQRKGALNIVTKKTKAGKTDQAANADKTIIAQNLPKQDEYTEIDLVTAFAKYGSVQCIKPINNDSSSSSTLIVFKTVKAAKNALAAGNIKFKANKKIVTVKVTPYNITEKKKQFEEKKDCTVYVRNLKQGMTEEDLKQHFANCGDIDNVFLVIKRGFGFVTFKEPNSVQAALKLHCSTLNSATIGVYLHCTDNRKSKTRDPKRTIFLRNVQKLETLSKETLEAIFKKFGDIEDIDIVCGKNVLAFITFTKEGSIKKALDLNGSTVDKLQLEICGYVNPVNNVNTSVFMLNVKPGVKEENIRQFFATAGEISDISIKAGFAIVKFINTDGFCKSFLLNEAILAGQPVFLEPFSEKKQQYIKKGQYLQQRKRTFHQKAEGTTLKKPRKYSD